MNKLKFTYKGLRELQSLGIDLDELIIEVDKEQIGNLWMQKIVNLSENTPIQKTKNPTENRYITVSVEKVQSVFDCGRQSIYRGCLKGVRYLGNRSGKCQINLEHPEIKRFNITEDCFKTGKKKFFKTAYVKDMLGFKSYTPVYNCFDDSDFYSIGRDRRVFIDSVQSHLSNLNNNTGPHKILGVVS